MRLATTRSLSFALAGLFAGLGVASGQEVGQTFVYRLNDTARFTEGYRRHLQWHREHRDSLPWYAWTVVAGPRKGLFIDGTFGTTFAGLDGRPDIHGDSEDFARNAAPYASSLANDTWTLWKEPTNAQPLEERRPAAFSDVFLLDVVPARIVEFEALLGRAHAASGAVAATWYRPSRGSSANQYMLMLHRSSWHDVQAAPALLDVLRTLYGKDDAAALLSSVSAVQGETWKYEPRLALLPNEPLAP